MQRWWAHMADIMATNPDGSPVAIPLIADVPPAMTASPARVSASSTSARPTSRSPWWTCRTRTEIAVLTRPNHVLPGPPWPHFDTEGHWDFILDALAQLHAAHGIEALAVTTHGACAALLAADGTLAAPVLDYEHDGPEALRDAFHAIRPPFAETGTPALKMGLSVGAQLFWQFAARPDAARPHGAHPVLAAILGASPDGRGRRRPDLAWLPYRPVEPASRHLLVAGRQPWHSRPLCARGAPRDGPWPHPARGCRAHRAVAGHARDAQASTTATPRSCRT